MVQSIWEDVKREFSYGNMVTRIIIVNVAIYLFVNIVYLLLFLGFGHSSLNEIYAPFLHFFCISSDWIHNLTHPWVFFTHMFLHDGFWHILWNMLLLYWFGRIVGDFLGNQRILPLYLMGGLAGAVAYFISVPFLPVGSFALGASAAVMAIIVAAGVISPDYIMRLFLIGDVKLKYIVAFLVLMNLFLIPGGGNTGGYVAHLGGAAFGWLFVFQLRQGQDWSIPVNNLLDRITNFWNRLISGKIMEKPRRKPRVVYKNTSANKRSNRGSSRSDSMSKSHQEQLDAILDKIKQSGYESLSEEEKEFLFNASKK